GPLNAAGIIVLQGVTSDANGVMVETTLLHESTEWIADTLFLPVPQQTPQAYGSAITYGSRYSLQSIVALPAEDDDGNKASEAATEPKKSDGARAELVALFDAMDDEQKDVMRSHAAEIRKLHAVRGDVVSYLAEQNFGQEEKMALWSLLASNVRSWI